MIDVWLLYIALSRFGVVSIPARLITVCILHARMLPLAVDIAKVMVDLAIPV